MSGMRPARARDLAASGHEAGATAGARSGAPGRVFWRRSAPGLAAVAFFSVFLNLLKFATPLYMLQVLDRVPASRSVETLVLLTAVALLAIAASLALETIRQQMLARWAQWTEDLVAPRLLQAHLAAGTLDGEGAQADAIGDVQRLRTLQSKTLAFWLDAAWAPVFILGVYVVSPALGHLAAVSLVLLALLGIVQERVLRDPRREAQAAGSEAREVVANARRQSETVRGLSMGDALAHRWRETAVRRSDERMRAEARAAFMRTAMRALGEGMRIGIVALGVYLFVEGAISLGGVFAARVMAGFGYRLAERAARNAQAAREGVSGYRAIMRQLKRLEDVPPASPLVSPRAALRFEDVWFRYPGRGGSALKGVDAFVAPGEMLLVAGNAGSGKSTFARLAVGLLEPRRGQVLLGETAVTRIRGEERLALVGYMPQHTELFPGTVRENIARMGEGAFEDVVAAARRAGIHETIVRLPQGYDTLLTEEPGFLAGSERKRIAFARAIYGAPRLVVLDEPLANLDRPARRSLEGAIRALKSEGCAVIVTQASRSSRLAALAERSLALKPAARPPAEPRPRKEAPLAADA